MAFKPLIKKEKKESSGLGALFFHGLIFYILLLILMIFSSGIFLFYKSEKNAQLSIENGQKSIQEQNKVILNFDVAMLKDSVERNLVITPKDKVALSWLDDRNLKIQFLNKLLPERKYKIEDTGAQTVWLIHPKKLSTAFFSPVFPDLEKVSPANYEEGVNIKEEITFNFSEPVHKDFYLEVVVDPFSSSFDYVFNEERTQLKIIPKEPMKYEQEYKIKLNVSHRRDKKYVKKVYQGVFKTQAPPYVVYSFDKDGKPLKTEKRKEKITPVIKEGKYIHIDLSSQTLFIFQDGKELGAYKISSGKRGMTTPLGSFKVLLKARRPFSKEHSLFMPWFIGFTRNGHGIHELPEWRGGLKEGANHLGIPVSHGCVRLGIGPAKKVYDFAEKGTPIIIQQ